VSVLVAVAKEVVTLDGTLLAWASPSLRLQLAIPGVPTQPKFVRRSTIRLSVSAHMYSTVQLFSISGLATHYFNVCQ